MNTPATPLTLAIPADTGLEIESLASLKAMFEPFFLQAEEWRTKALACVVTSVDDKRGMKFARESRLALREIRVAVEKRRKEAKEDSLRKGKAIDGFANIFKAAVEPIESFLLEQEEFAERAEKARLDALRDARMKELAEAGGSSYAGDICTLNGYQFKALLQDARDLVTVRKAREAAAEAARIEAIRIEQEQREAIAAENAKLKAEAAAREAALAIERLAAAKEAASLKAEADAVVAAEREAARLEAEKAKAAHDAERAEAKKVAAELQAKADAAAKLLRDAAAKAEAEAKSKREAEEAAEAAPDKEKLIALAATIRSIAVPELTSRKGKTMARAIQEAIEQLAQRVEIAAAKFTPTNTEY